MIVHALSKAKEAGYTAVFLQGDPQFYGKFGFIPAHRLGIYHQTDPTRKAEHCMVHLLTPGALDGIAGMTDYE
jgi:predicted N-acetyltransferase YhbS